MGAITQIPHWPLLSSSSQEEPMGSRGPGARQPSSGPALASTLYEAVGRSLLTLSVLGWPYLPWEHPLNQQSTGDTGKNCISCASVLVERWKIEKTNMWNERQWKVLWAGRGGPGSAPLWAVKIQSTHIYWVSIMCQTLF